MRSLSGLSLSFAALLTWACTGTTTGGDDGALDPGGDDDGGGGGGNGDGDGDGGGIDPGTPGEGVVSVVLHPGPSIATGEPVVVSFGAPFPPGAVSDAGLLSARLGEQELAIHAEALLPWRAWPGRADATESIRAAMISVEVTFAERAPLEIELAYGEAPGATLPAPADPRAGWVAVNDGEFPSSVREPAVYAAFPPAWLSDCLLRSRATPVGGDPAYAWLDDALVGFAHTAVNDVPDAVVERIDVTGDAEPWLFDRTMTLFGVHVRTGDVKWLRHAHRSAQFYKGRITGDGYFDLKDGDLKYAYGRSLLTDYLFTGDPELLDAIERIAGAGERWDPVYELDDNFWTERHQTYALLAALSAWEASGDARHAERVSEIVDASFSLASDPPGNWPRDGCMLHGMTAHEGAGGDVPICSPWMSALFADAVWEYYVHSRDERALTFLADLGQYVLDHGLYDGGEGIDLLMPWYLSSSQKKFSDAGPWGDVEHTCDVAGLVARGAWARKQLGGDHAEMSATAATLLEGCAWNLDMWYRPGSTEHGKAEWRLTPARKFNWWFGTTSDVTWLMSELE
ncbi:MAG TPA: hypothetical protein VKZ63_21080 [Kofleriaceae bacterium]|nr:hypothetical protein [Kofleriaceae bacterium]